jgi:hypothetical protein
VAIFKCADQTAKDLPAWVQAVGSVMAILSVFWVNALNQRKEHLARNQSILAIAKTAYEFASAIRAELEMNFNANLPNFDGSKIRSLYDAEISRSYGKALANVPFHEAGSTEVVQALFFLQAQFAVLFPKSIDELLSGPLAPQCVVTSWGGQKNMSSFIQEKTPAVLAQIDEIDGKWLIVKRGLS